MPAGVCIVKPPGFDGAPGVIQQVAACCCRHALQVRNSAPLAALPVVEPGVLATGRVVAVWPPPSRRRTRWAVHYREDPARFLNPEGGRKFSSPYDLHTISTRSRSGRHVVLTSAKSRSDLARRGTAMGDSDATDASYA